MTDMQLALLSSLLILLGTMYFVKLVLENELVDLVGYGSILLALGYLLGKNT